MFVYYIRKAVIIIIIITIIIIIIIITTTTTTIIIIIIIIIIDPLNKISFPKSKTWQPLAPAGLRCLAQGHFSGARTFVLQGHKKHHVKGFSLQGA